MTPDKPDALENVEPQRKKLDDVEPQRKKLDDGTYIKELGRLQIELVKLQEWIRERGLKLVTIFEGRDAAGKGGTIKRVTETLNPRFVRVVALGVPTEREVLPVVLPALRPPPAGRRRVGDLRPLLVQPGRRRARHGVLHRRRRQRVLPLVPALRRDAHPQRHHPREVLVQRERRRAGAALQGPHHEPHQALEDLRDGPCELGQVGRVLARQGRDVPLHRHQALALVRGQLRRQEARPPERDPPPAERHPLRRPHAQALQAAAAPRDKGYMRPPYEDQTFVPEIY